MSAATVIASIAKLEALLARVVTRSAEPRATSRAVQPAPQAAPVPAAADLLDEEPDQPTLPPPPVAHAEAVHVPPPAPHRAPVLELSVDVDMTDAPVDEVAVPPTEPAVEAFEPTAPAEALGSQERLVAVEPVPVDAPHTAPEPPPALALEAAEETIPEPPASSRRPLAPQPEERLAEMAFGSDEPRPPLHTPPPESGRLPAAPEVDFADEDTGVRAAVPVAQPAAALTSETTRAELAGADRVASIQGGVRPFAPTTFAELLQASLSL